jgi:hypothetical protein
MQKSIVQMILVVMSVVGMAGCAGVSDRIFHGEKGIQERSTMPRHLHDLAGAWEYEDKTWSSLIRLNEEGKGSYDWEDGWFKTHELKEGVWTGKWFQAGNDREGGFKLKWAGDLPVARGRWWYTRIGLDSSHIEPGGTFTMKRASSLSTTGNQPLSFPSFIRVGKASRQQCG